MIDVASFRMVYYRSGTHAKEENARNVAKGDYYATPGDA